MTEEDLDRAIEKTLGVFDKEAALMTLPQYEHALYQIIGSLKDRLNALTDDTERLTLEDV